MLSSCLVVVVVGNKLVGGSGTVFRKSYEAGRIEIFNLDFSLLTRHTFWSQVKIKNVSERTHRFFLYVMGVIFDIVLY